MKAAFDDSAAGYDNDFTNTSVGRLQRNKVWNYLENAFPASFPENVLELNCGTGEDAAFFAAHGCHVLATDISEQMLSEASAKISNKKLDHLVETRKISITDISSENVQERYDLIFSDFGGLNCIDPQQLEKLLNNLAQLLTPKGRIILVIMPRFCTWETIYFTARLDFNRAFRRRMHRSQKASVGNSQCDVWYHSPRQVQRSAAKYYDLVNIQPVGISIPPSYLQKTFLTKSRILNKLDALENRLNKYGFLSGMADHYLIDLQLK